MVAEDPVHAGEPRVQTRDHSLLLHGCKSLPNSVLDQISKSNLPRLLNQRCKFLTDKNVENKDQI